MYERVLVPTDGSEGSANAAMRAIDLAQQYGAAIHVLHVVDSSGSSLVGDIRSGPDPAERGERAIEKIETMAEAHGIEVTVGLREGDPADEILTYAEEIEADIIVAGTHGRSGIERRLIGSVAERLVRHANCPVLTVQLPDTDVTVEDSDHAEEVAESTLADEGYEADVVGARRQRHLWVAEAEDDDGGLLVYVDPVTQRASIVSQVE
jgi:nucleotide-binding universal stress UspA family protein